MDWLSMDKEREQMCEIFLNYKNGGRGKHTPRQTCYKFFVSLQKWTSLDEGPLMVERLWEKFSIYINFENFLDTRQTRFDSIYTGSINNPVFRDVYAPLDGFVINGGLKFNL